MRDGIKRGKPLLNFKGRLKDLGRYVCVRVTRTSSPLLGCLGVLARCYLPKRKI